jgi:hypothetical protein
MPENMRWRAADRLVAAALLLATAGFTLWQNTRVAVLWDLSYLLDSAWRFSLGQVPYREIPFAHAPLTFLLHAGLIRIFGRVYMPHVWCAALEAGIATVLTWRILRGLAAAQPGVSRPSRLWSLLLALPLVFVGIYGIYPHPIYDSDAALAVLLGLYLLQKAEAGDSGRTAFAAGAVCVLPLFFKQNIGLAFLAAVVAYGTVGAIRGAKQKQGSAPWSWLLTGVVAGLLTALALLQSWAGLRNYFYWTVTFAAQRRLPGVALLMGTYWQHSLLWTIPAALAGAALLRWNRLRRRDLDVAAALMLAAPFLWVLLSLPFTTDADERADQLLGLWPHLLLLSALLAITNLRPRVLARGRLFPALLPWVLLATIHGDFLSQQLWGSTYAMWPLLMLLLWGLLQPVRRMAGPLAIVISATLVVCGAAYSMSLERLDYIHRDGPVMRASQPVLRGMATPGAALPQLEGLVAATNAEIPRDDGVLLIPGEVPFFFATGRVPRFPILLFDRATDPYSPQQTLVQARSHDIRWLIVSRNPQLAQPALSNLDAIVSLLETDFELQRPINGYDIYRRKDRDAATR